MVQPINKTSWKDFPLSLLLGAGFCGLMGLLHGLRILDMTPELVINYRNIFFLLLHSIYLYAILGFIVGTVLWVAMWVFSHIFRLELHGRAFIRGWVKTYLIMSLVLLVYLAVTRQDLRSGNFDNLLLIV